jgi:sulfate adenylyltransferase subunit 1 (EFTu-like GTPase family)
MTARATLIGRLLYESKMLFEDQAAAAASIADSKQERTSGR